MIRLIQRRLIVPRGDTGTFSIPMLANKDGGDVSVFTIFNPLKHEKIFEKVMQLSEGTLSLAFSHGDTVNLPVGQYVWDIKFYSDPVFVDEQLVGGTEVDSYYAAFSLPVCEIRETGDSLLMSDDAPQATLAPEQIDLITGAINEANFAKDAAATSEANAATSAETASTAAESANSAAELAQQYSEDAIAAKNRAVEAETNASASAAEAAASAAEVLAEMPTKVSDLENDLGFLTEHQDISGKADIADLAAVAMSGSYEDLENKPFIPANTSDLVNDSNFAVDANYIHTDNNYTTAEKDKLSSIAAGAEVNVNADWNAVSGDAQILNKPTNVSAFANDVGYLTEHQDISGKANSADLAAVATSGNYNDLLNKPSIPTKVSDLTDDSGHYIKPATGIPASDLEEAYLTEHQDLSNYVQKTDYATNSTAGLVYADGSGIDVNPNNGYLFIHKALAADIKSGVEVYRPIVPQMQHGSVFYGLAKAAGDTTQSQSSNTVGVYTNDAKTAIQQMLDVPSTSTVTNEIATAIGSINSFDMAVVQQLPTQDISTHTIYLVPKTGETNDVYDEYVYINNTWEMVGNTQIDLSNYATLQDIPNVPVQDVQIDGTSILQNGIAVIPVRGNVAGTNELVTSAGISNAFAAIFSTTLTQIKAGTQGSRAISPANQDAASFYGLAKAAGDTTQSQSANAVGTYTDAAKTAIQGMLDVPSNTQLVLESGASIGAIQSKAYNYNNDTFKSAAIEMSSIALGTNAVAGGQFSYAGNASLAIGKFAHAEGTDYIRTMLISGAENSTIYNNVQNVTGLLKDDYLVSFERSIVVQVISNDDSTGNIVVSKTFGEECNNLLVAVYRTGAIGNYTHTEGIRNTAIGQAAHAEGRMTMAKGEYSHAEGRSTEAIGSNTHAEGFVSYAIGDYSHAEGSRSISYGIASHAEGNNYNQYYIYLTNNNEENSYNYTIPTNDVIVKIGDIIALNNTLLKVTAVEDQKITLNDSFTEQCNNTQAALYCSGAFGLGSHVEGNTTIAHGSYQHVQGTYNIPDLTNLYADIIGNGSTEITRSNAYALTWTGDGHYAGNVYVGANADSTGGTKVLCEADFATDLEIQNIINGGAGA